MRPVQGKTWSLFANCSDLVRIHMCKIGCQIELNDEEVKMAEGSIQDNMVQLVYDIALQP